MSAISIRLAGSHRNSTEYFLKYVSFSAAIINDNYRKIAFRAMCQKTALPEIILPNQESNSARLHFETQKKHRNP